MPLAEIVEEGREIIETAKACDRRVFVDLFLRHEFAYTYFASIVKGKSMGKCKALYVKRQTPPWWGNLDKKHIALNLMHHDIDFVSQLFGEARDIQVCGLDVQDEQSVVTAEFIYEDCFATVHVSSAMPQIALFIVGYEAVFEKGFVRYFEDGYADGKLEIKHVTKCH